MEDFVRLLTSDEGDSYLITISEDTTLFSKETLQIIGNVKVAGIELQRLTGSAPTSVEMLTAIGNVIADYFLSHNDVMIFYYCDFINRIPYTNKKEVSPQEYRSNLFRLMFERYMSMHNVDNVHLSVITVQGVEETFYFHLIYRECHAHLAPIISQDINEGYSK